MAALQKQSLSLNFAKGLDLKTDPFQVTFGNMLSLENAIFDTFKQLRKRNGFGPLPALPNSSSTTLATFSGSLVAVGANTFNILSNDNMQWLSRGYIQSVGLTTVAAARANSNMISEDAAVCSNGLACVSWTDSTGNSYYQIFDSVTGNIVIPSTKLNATANRCRVNLLGNYFVITYLATVSATPHLQYIAIPINNPSNPGTPTDISTQVKSITTGYDCSISSTGNMYVAWNGSDGGGAIRLTFIDQFLTQHNTVVLATEVADVITITCDSATSTPVIWISWYTSSTNSVRAAVYDQNLILLRGAFNVLTSVTVTELTATALNNVLTLFVQETVTYGYSAVRTDHLVKVKITLTFNGSIYVTTINSTTTIMRGVGLASKAFYYPTTALDYVLVTYGGSFQPTYFLVDENGRIFGKLAYQNGGGYKTDQILSNVTLTGNLAQIGYQFKDLLVPINKTIDGQQTPIYAQLGVNLASFTLNTTNQITSEIGGNLHITGGILWAYDGAFPVEQNFNVFPEDIGLSTATTGGFLTDQQYYYSVTYEWTDAQGNLHRSAPSIAQTITTSGGNTSTVTLNIPTLRLTAKTGVNNPVRIVIYRWSVAQQTFYQITSITAPLLNDTTVDSVSYVDTLADSSILGNVILYTTGGVLENIGPPSFSSIALYKSRLMGLDSEDSNLIWYSKQVIEATPVEMTDLQTIYVAPTTSAQGNTGPNKCISAMDDKFIIFKPNAIYYLTGNGPDITGANNDFSDPTFITSTVGCSNQNSIVFIPQGLMFQSDKGIWLLGRDLSTNYIGYPVEKFNSTTVLAAVNVPGTNQVRFTMSNGTTLMYDYFFNQWGTFTNIPAISSTLFESKHTYLDAFGRVFQETPGLYLDGTSPVQMQFTTGWLNLTGLQGFQRAYFFYLLGTYISPHKLIVSVAYDYQESPQQTSVILPDNFNPPYGGDSVYGGGSPYGDNSAIEQWRIFNQIGKCEAMQISVQEVFDPTFGTAAGAGLTLSGINFVYGAKKTYTTIKAARSVG